MPTERLSMRKIRDVLRLRFESGLSERVIARSMSLSNGSLDKEMRRKGVTLALLWEEYRGAHPDGFGYSWFCERYCAFKSQLRPTMRQAMPPARRSLSTSPATRSTSSALRPARCGR